MGKTHFEQVPLEAIKGILEENTRQERIETDREARGTTKKNWETDILETTTANERGERL
jgi:hypothetical protein